MDPELKEWLQILTPGLIPTLAVLIAMLQNKVGLDAVNKRIDDLRDHVNRRFDAVDKRFDGSEAIWRAELRRVEEVLDARLKHLPG
ncbi:MAG TPA: hypothetical protein VH325_16325 [Bryobacteraceae bacterium]|jgi:hypothetical protein|nr:hypothetical protein [Bryobacteraceae bacterium]